MKIKKTLLYTLVICLSIFIFIEISFQILINISSKFSYTKSELSSILDATKVEKRKHRVVCIGESTTDGQYPKHLQTRLDQLYPQKYRVYDFGKTGVTTFYFEKNIRKIIKHTRPHTVITMLGINDDFQLSALITESNTFASKLFTYRFLLYLKDLKNNNFEDQAIKLINTGNFKIAYPMLKILYAFNVKMRASTYDELITLYQLHKEDQLDILNLINHALSYYPHHNALRLARLSIYHELKNFYGVVDELEYLSKIDNMSAELASFYFSSFGDIKKARNLFEKARLNNQLDKYSALEYATLLNKEGEEEKSKKVLSMAYTSAKGNSAISQIEEKRFSKRIIMNLNSIYQMILDSKSNLLIMNYPLRPIGPIKKIFQSINENALFIDNEANFKNSIKNDSYKDIFADSFAGDFGHLTDKGNEILVDNLIENYFRLQKN
ncbi:MAG: hypothetical protein HN576_12455 [Bacteriovoracaceae bacterium]|jgi:hypothetical protein|nr:hypothetical protein [Bacteriovoracaceae bacterium]